MSKEVCSFSCPFCGQFFNKKFNLKRHIISKHSAKQKRVAAVEEEPSTSSTHLVQQSNPFKHEKIVNGERRYLCTQCGLLFGRKFNLKRHHTAKHTNESSSKKRLNSTNKGDVKTKDSKKTFYCSICNDKFSRRFNLQRHVRTVHPDSHINNKKQRVYCQLCQTYSCLNLFKLSQHLNEVHQIPIVEVDQEFSGLQNVNRLIDGFRQCFSISIKQKQADQFLLRCNYSTEFLNKNNETFKSPCIFHLNIEKIDSIYNVKGCYSHFGHEVVNQLPIDQYIDQNSVDTDEEFKLFDSIANDYLTDLQTTNDSLNIDNGNEFLLSQTEKLIKTEPVDNSQHRYSNPETVGYDQHALDKSNGKSVAQMSSKINDEYLHKLTVLEKLTPNVYRANFLRSPTGKPGNAYGGLLFAQSLKAALATVDTTKFFPHSMHSFFILNVDSTKTVNYKIENIRDGRSFTTRSVNAEQNSKIVMSSQISFCVKEDTSIEHQIKMPNVPGPESLLSAVDFCKDKLDKYEKGEVELSTNTVNYFRSTIESSPENIFEFRPVNPTRYYGLEKSESVDHYYFWLKAACSLSDDPQEHLFLTAYLTDMTLAGAANRPHASHGYKPSMVLSLDHNAYFHDFDYRVDQWLLYENWSTWAKHGRAFSEGRLWTQDGRLLVSTSQESLSRTRGEKSSL